MDVQSINCYYIIQQILVSIVVSIPACHAGDRGSIPRRGGIFDAGKDDLVAYQSSYFDRI